MSAGFSDNNSDDEIYFPVFTHSSNDNLCPYTFESVKDCMTRNSIDDHELCFYMLEPCSFPKRERAKKKS
jgi:hypothetical protein